MAKQTREASCVEVEVNTKTLTAGAMVRRLGKSEIDLAPEYQRGKVWSRNRQALLVDSMLRGYDLPKIYTRKVEGGPEEVVDGQQRLTAIAAFLQDKVALPKESGEFARKKYLDLPSELQDRLTDYQLHFSVITDADDTEIREMFLRLQMGVRLNAAEELNAIAGGMHDFVAILSELPLFEKKISFSNNRGAHRHVAAQLARLAVMGTGDCRKADLLQMYKSHSGWTPDDKAKRLRQVIEWAPIVFEDRDPILRNRGQTVSMLWGLYSLWTDLDFKNQEIGVRQALKNLDQAVLSDQHAFAPYRLALSHSSDQKKSIEERGHFVLGAIAQWAPDLIRRDPKRIFSSEERAAIYYRDGGVCQEAGCGVAVKFTDFHADHVIPWVHGGVTKLSNAQLLCAPHNLVKGAKKTT